MTFFGCSARSLGLGLYDHTSKPVLGGRCLALESENGGFSNFQGWPKNRSRTPPVGFFDNFFAPTAVNRQSL